MSSTLTTLPDSINVLQQIQSFSVLMATFNGIMLWEVVTCFPAEAKYIFWPEFKEVLCHRKLPTLASVLLFNARILALLLAGISFAMIAPTSSVGTSGNFNGSFKAYVFLFSASVFNGTAIFVIRTLAIRDSKLPMTVFLWCNYLVLCTFHLVCAGLVKMPSQFVTFTSFPSPLDQYLPWILFVGCNIAFDILVLCLSLEPQMEKFKWKPTYSQVARRFYLDAIGYFGISLVVSIFDFGWIIAHRSDGISVAMATPIHIWLVLTIAPRVIRNLRLHSAKQKSGANQELSKLRSPFVSIMESSLPCHNPSTSQVDSFPMSTPFIISKERTVHYPSSLYSNSN